MQTRQPSRPPLNITIAYLNIGGLYSKATPLSDWMKEKSIDAVLLSETKASAFSTNLINAQLLAPYRFLSLVDGGAVNIPQLIGPKNNPRISRGLGIVYNPLVVSVTSLPPLVDFSPATFPICPLAWVQIVPALERRSKFRLRACVAYFPPKLDRQKFSMHLHSMVASIESHQLLCKPEETLLVGGDFNAHLPGYRLQGPDGDRCDPHGDDLLREATTTLFLSLTNDLIPPHLRIPTFDSQGESTVDYVFHLLPPRTHITRVACTTDLVSEHRPIIVDMQTRDDVDADTNGIAPALPCSLKRWKPPRFKSVVEEYCTQRGEGGSPCEGCIHAHDLSVTDEPAAAHPVTDDNNGSALVVPSGNSSPDDPCPEDDRPTEADVSKALGDMTVDLPPDCSSNDAMAALHSSLSDTLPALGYKVLDRLAPPKSQPDSFYDLDTDLPVLAAEIKAMVRRMTKLPAGDERTALRADMMAVKQIYRSKLQAARRKWTTVRVRRLERKSVCSKSFWGALFRITGEKGSDTSPTMTRDGSPLPASETADALKKLKKIIKKILLL